MINTGINARTEPNARGKEIDPKSIPMFCQFLTHIYLLFIMVAGISRNNHLIIFILSQEYMKPRCSLGNSFL